MTIDRLPSVVLRALTAACVALASVLGTVTTARAAAPDDSAVAPYVGEGTFLVAALDVDRVDGEALLKLMDDATRAALAALPIPANQHAMVAQSAKQSAQGAKQWLTDLAAAGGKRLYCVFDVADFDGGNDEHPYIVIPLGPGADAAKITEVLQRGPGKSEDVVEIGRAVVLADSRQQERLRKTVETPVKRAELAPALAAAGEAPLRMALLPSDAAVAWLEGAVPNLADVLGGGDKATAAVRGVRWASAAVVQHKPSTVATLTIRAKDGEHAKAVLDAVNKGAALLKQNPPPLPPDEAKDAITATDPKLDGETIRLTINPIALQMTMMRAEMKRQGVPGAPPPAPAGQPPKPDDGGL